MLSFLRSSIIEKITKSNIFILYISNYLIRYFRFFLLPYEKEWNVFKHIKISNNDIILDIGAHWGESVLTFRKYYTNIIYSYEPDTDSFKHLKKISKNKNVKCFNYGINKYKKKIKLYFPSFKKNKLTLWGCANLDRLKRRINNFTYLDSEKIQYVSNMYSFKNINLKEAIGIIKIDVEGSEYEVLKGINRESIRKSKLIFLEYHPENFQKCNNFLKNIGFKCFLFRNERLKKVNLKQILKEVKYKKNTTNVIFKRNNVLI
jgi:FkbM family methyltransferase